ncbi:MAG TPA: ribosome maturation factor RimM [Candidatus Limnocylindrales bacterium]|nr:ribosome maturation factor RimM [Candidatus Limnocylindrales bacterium]
MAGTSSSRSSTTRSERRLALARVLGVKGLRGGVRVEILTDWPERLDAGASLFADGSDEPLVVSRTEVGGRVPVLYFAGRETRESVEPLVGRYLEAVARPLDDGSYYWEDLIGLRVEEPDGSPVGELVEIFRAGGNEVYRVVGTSGERLVPALRSAVLEIDLDAQRIVVAPDDSETV